MHLEKTFYDEWGVAVAAQIVGIAYNPKKVDRPKGWKDLFEPKYNGKVGISGFGTTFGTSSLIEISKHYGGSLTNVDPAFEQLKKWLPHVGGDRPEPGGGQHALPAGTDGRDLHELSRPSRPSRAAGSTSSSSSPRAGRSPSTPRMHVVKNATNKDNAYRFIDTVLSTEVQTALQKPPYSLLSVNKNVPLQPDLPADLVKSHDELASFVHHDWRQDQPASARRWIERFNKEIRQ